MNPNQAREQTSTEDNPPVWATRYAAAGLPVLPLHWPVNNECSCGSHQCRNVGKHPITPHGKDDATTDPETVAAWWSRWPEANIGIRPPTGVIVLDVDPRNGGVASLLDIRARVGALPATRSARTGGGGLHIWFAYGGNHGARLRHRGDAIPGIDVKSHSGYLVAPPSLHASGRRYSWIDQHIETSAPTWLRYMLDPPQLTAAPLPHRIDGDIDSLVRFVSDSGEGELNNRLYWAAARAHERGLDPVPLIDAAVAKGHPRRGAERTAESAANAPSRHGVVA